MKIVLLITSLFLTGHAYAQSNCEQITFHRNKEEGYTAYQSPTDAPSTKQVSLSITRIFRKGSDSTNLTAIMMVPRRAGRIGTQGVVLNLEDGSTFSKPLIPLIKLETGILSPIVSAIIPMSDDLKTALRRSPVKTVMLGAATAAPAASTAKSLAGWMNCILEKPRPGGL